MKQVSTFSILAIVIAFFSIAQAQIQPKILELIPPEGQVRPSAPQLLGVETKDGQQNLVFQIVHPGGGIQQVRGSLMSGGKKPENLPAYGKVSLGAGITPADVTLTWMASPRASNSVNYFSVPFSSGGGVSKANLLAKNGEIITAEAFTKYKSTLQGTGFRQIPVAKDKARPDPNAPHVETYKETLITAGMGGKISYLTTMTHTVKPVDRRYTGLLGSAYTMKAKTNRDETKTAFGDDQLSFKSVQNLREAVAIANDPLSGNAAILGGLKYKKDKTKAQSFYYEHMLLVFGNDGKLVNRERVDTETPMVFAAYPIEGQRLAPQVAAVPHVVFIGDGVEKGKLEGANGKQKMIVVVDMSTGKVIHKSLVELKGVGANLLTAQSDRPGELRLLFSYRFGAGAGFTELLVNAEGVQDRVDLPAGKSAMQEMVNGSNMHLATNFKMYRSFETKDGKLVTLNGLRFVKKDAKTGKEVVQVRGYCLLVRNSQGQLLHALPLPGLKESSDVNYQMGNGNQAFFTYPGKAGAPSVLALSMDGEGQQTGVFSEPAAYRIVGKRPYLHLEENAIYFLAQMRDAGGLYLSRFQF